MKRIMVKTPVLAALCLVATSVFGASTMPLPVIYDPLDGTAVGTRIGPTGGIFTNDALHGQALMLHGPNDAETKNRLKYSFTPYSASAPSGTIMMWIKPTYNWATNQLSTQQNWILNDSSSYLYLYTYHHASYNAPIIEWGNWGISGQVDGSIFADWFHIALVFSNVNAIAQSVDRRVMMHVNGIQKLNWTGPALTNKTEMSSFYIGANHNTKSMKATVDEILFFREALTPAQVKEIYTRTKFGGASFGDLYIHPVGTVMLVR